MADTKTSSLTAETAPLITDKYIILDDPGGSPLLKNITIENTYKTINGLTEDTQPNGAADYIASFDASAGAGRKILSRRAGSYTLQSGSFTASNPADSTSYYFGSFFSNGPSTTAAGRRIYLPYPGIITAVDVYFIIDGTLATTETSTLSIRKNNTTNTTVTTAINLSATPYHERVTGLSVDLTTANDYFEFLWVSPAWSTNPTNVYTAFVAFIAQSG